MKNPEIRLTGHNMNVIVTPDLKIVAVHCNEVVSREGKPALSGKDILLEMTPAQAMLLLQHLQGVQQALGLPLPSAPTHVLNVPPNKDRN